MICIQRAMAAYSCDVELVEGNSKKEIFDKTYSLLN